MFDKDRASESDSGSGFWFYPSRDDPTEIAKTVNRIEGDQLYVITDEAICDANQWWVCYQLIKCMFFANSRSVQRYENDLMDSSGPQAQAMAWIYFNESGNQIDIKYNSNEARM